MRRNIQGMVVVITGASSGIGASLARMLHERGAKLALSARRMDRLETLNSQLGGGHLIQKADVSKSIDCLHLVREAHDKFGRIDVMVCNAGYGEMRTVQNTDAETLKAMFATNVLGTTECIRAAVPRMLEQEPRDGCRGQIMIVSSGAARRGLPYYGVYSATKAAQLSVSEALRVELNNTGVAVTSVHPVGTSTEFFEVAQQRGGTKMPARKTGDVQQTPEQVAKAMIRGMEKPRPEVWPFRAARYGLAFGALFPGVLDRVMTKYRGDIEGV